MKDKRTTVLIILNIFISFCLVSSSLFFKLIIDAAIKKENIMGYLIGIICLIALMTLLKIIYQINRNKYSLALEVNLKKQVFDELMAKKMSEIVKYHSGELANYYLTDVKNVMLEKTEAIPNLALSLSRFVFAFLMLIYVDYKLLLLLIAFGLILAVFAKVFANKLKKLHKDALVADDKTNIFMQESMENIRLIKANNNLTTIDSHLDCLLKDNYQKKNKRNMISIVGNIGLSTVANICYMGTICYGAIGIFYSFVSYGSLMALLQLVSYVESPFSAIPQILNKIYAGNASASRLKNIGNLINEDDNEEISDFSKIEIKNLSFSYDFPIYENFNLTINKNDIIVLKGESGAGKTTLFNLLLGFLEPKTGSITIYNQDKATKASKASRNLFSYVPQENILFSATILENIHLFCPNASLEEITVALQRCDVYDEIMKLDKKLDQRLNERGNGLSIGQIQRVLISIALLQKKPILLLDEFSSALDFSNEEKIVKELIKEKKTIIMISHRDVNIVNKKEILINSRK